MGFLVDGTPLSWPETKALANQIRQQGIRQFIRTYHEAKQRNADPFKFGDEVSRVVSFSHFMTALPLSLSHCQRFSWST